jgi:histidinol-phosphate aminotransferase
MTTLGFEVLPSRANFLFATHPKHPASVLYARLRERGIIVRHFDKPRIENYLRISIGSEEANNSLLSAFQELV